MNYSWASGTFSLDHPGHVFGYGSLEPELAASDGMNEAELRRVQQNAGRR